MARSQPGYGSLIVYRPSPGLSPVFPPPPSPCLNRFPKGPAPPGSIFLWICPCVTPCFTLCTSALLGHDSTLPSGDGPYDYRSVVDWHPTCYIVARSPPSFLSRCGPFQLRTPFPDLPFFRPGTPMHVFSSDRSRPPQAAFLGHVFVPRGPVSFLNRHDHAFPPFIYLHLFTVMFAPLFYLANISPSPSQNLSFNT